jgi:hypothetical protein
MSLIVPPCFWVVKVYAGDLNLFQSVSWHCQDDLVSALRGKSGAAHLFETTIGGARLKLRHSGLGSGWKTTEAQSSQRTTQKSLSRNMEDPVDILELKACSWLAPVFEIPLCSSLCPP